MSLCSPLMLSVMSGDALASKMLMPSLPNNRAAARDVLVDILVLQLTADVLSQNAATCTPTKDGRRHSSAIHSSTSPANSRSFIVNMPFSKAVFISFVHSTCHTTGFIPLVPEVQTPPAPMPQASEYPMYSGGVLTSSMTEVGLCFICLTIGTQLCKHCFNNFDNGMKCFGLESASCSGDSMPLEPGTPKLACWSFPNMDSSRFLGIVRLKPRIFSMLSRIVSHFA